LQDAGDAEFRIAGMHRPCTQKLRGIRTFLGKIMDSVSKTIPILVPPVHAQNSKARESPEICAPPPYRCGHDHDQQRPVTPTKPQTMRCTPQSNIELMPEKEVLEVKPAPQPEQVGDNRPKQLEDRKHRSDNALIPTSSRESARMKFSGATGASPGYAVGALSCDTLVLDRTPSPAARLAQYFENAR